MTSIFSNYYNTVSVCLCRCVRVSVFVLGLPGVMANVLKAEPNIELAISLGHGLNCFKPFEPGLNCSNNQTIESDGSTGWIVRFGF